MRGSVIPRPATYRSTMSARRWAWSRSSFASVLRRCIGEDILELLHRLDGFVMGQIEMERRDGHEAGFHGSEVGSRIRLPDRRLTTDPEVLSPTRVEPFDDSFDVGSLSESGHPDSG